MLSADCWFSKIVRTPAQPDLRCQYVYCVLELMGEIYTKIDRKVN